jgi:hypothetical protein
MTVWPRVIRDVVSAIAAIIWLFSSRLLAGPDD